MLLNWSEDSGFNRLLIVQMRSVINLIYYQGMKYREAAEVLDIPVGTVKSRLHAAVMKLHEVWQRTHQEENET